jgi:hypothetical protein
VGLVRGPRPSKQIAPKGTGAGSGVRISGDIGVTSVASSPEVRAPQATKEAEKEGKRRRETWPRLQRPRVSIKRAMFPFDAAVSKTPW